MTCTSILILNPCFVQAVAGTDALLGLFLLQIKFLLRKGEVAIIVLLLFIWCH
jgi:uncharacterized membrane protein